MRCRSARTCSFASISARSASVGRPAWRASSYLKRSSSSSLLMKRRFRSFDWSSCCAREVGDLARVLAGRHAGVRVGERLRRLPVGGVGVEPLLLGGDRVLQAPDLQAVELRLVLLPRPAEDVVVGDAPEGADEEQQRGDEPDGAVRPLLVVDRGVAAGHASSGPALEQATHPEEGAPGRRHVELLPLIPVCHADPEPEADVGKADRLQELREEEHRTPPSVARARRQMLMLKYGVFSTMMYLMLRRCRISILATTAHMLRKRKPVSPKRAHPQRSMNAEKFAPCTHRQKA